MNTIAIKEALKNFLNEDIGYGDLSSETIFPMDEIGEGTFVVKADGVICGLFLAPMVYELLGGDVAFTPLVEEGSVQAKGAKIAKVTGPIRTLLMGERIILNLWQRMGGIATATKEAVDRLDDDTIRVCDTRKTAPGLRIFDKYAVTQGGGFNHRFGLDDGVMLKDNHIAFAGGIISAVEKVRKQLGHMVKIEVEIETLEQLKEAITAKADVIMFDNRSPKEVQEFQKIVPETIITEISGGITLENIGDYKETGADCISLGFLTHSVTALDISFNSTKGAKA